MQTRKQTHIQTIRRKRISPLELTSAHTHTHTHTHTHRNTHTTRHPTHPHRQPNHLTTAHTHTHTPTPTHTHTHTHPHTQTRLFRGPRWLVGFSLFHTTINHQSINPIQQNTCVMALTRPRLLALRRPRLLALRRARLLVGECA